MFGIDFTDKVAIVSGGGSGLGRGCSVKFAELGANVAICDLNLENARETAALVEKTGHKALAIKVDVTEIKQIFAAVKQAVDTMGGVDFLINSAGIHFNHAFFDMPEEKYDLIFDVNVKGTNYFCDAVLAHMLPKKSGKIINIASQAARKGTASAPHYCATKFAVVGLTQGIAMSCAPYNINVNSICPGCVRTAMWEKILDQNIERFGRSKEERETQWEEFVSKIPLGRPQELEDVANLAAFLCSPLASNMTGQAINLTGGSFMN